MEKKWMTLPDSLGTFMTATLNAGCVKPFHEQRVLTYNSTKEQIENNYLPYSRVTESLEAFTKQVREAGHLYQNGKIQPLPAQEKLNHEKENFLNKYEEFKDSFEKLKTIVENIHTAIDFMKPCERNYMEEQSLKENSPELYAQTKRHEEICLTYVRDLRPSYDSFLALQHRMDVQLHGNRLELGWALQRFCEIVDNHGNPLPLWLRSYNYMAQPVVPKPKGQQQNDPSISTEAKVEEDATAQKKEQADHCIGLVVDPKCDLKKTEQTLPNPSINNDSKPKTPPKTNAGNGVARVVNLNNRVARLQVRPKEVKMEGTKPDEKKNPPELNPNKTNV
jgi:hypothetical protein